MASSVDVLRRANAGIVKHVVSDLNGFWQTLNLSKPEQSRDALLRFTPALVTKYGDVAATVSADWYDEMRAGVGARGRFAAVMAALVPEDAVTGSVRYAAGDLFTDNQDGTLAFLEGSMARMALQAGRDTIVQSSIKDPASGGWERISSGGCDFCAMLAGRGPVYGQASADFPAHDHCQCEAVPVFRR